MSKFRYSFRQSLLVVVRSSNELEAAKAIDYESNNALAFKISRGFSVDLCSNGHGSRTGPRPCTSLGACGCDIANSSGLSHSMGTPGRRIQLQTPFM